MDQGVINLPINITIMYIYSSDICYGCYLTFLKNRDEAINKVMMIDKIIKTKALNSEFQIRLMNEMDKVNICKWEYTGEYKIYNLPKYEQMKNEKMGFANPNRIGDYYVVEHDMHGVVAFFGLIDEKEEVFIGIGVHPNYCSCGIGAWTLTEAIKIKNRRYGKKQLYLEVRTWNKRAINCYKKVGFKIVKDSIEQQTYAGQGTFCRMNYIGFNA